MLSNVTSVRVDISLWTYNKASRAYQQASVLATDVPNSGSTTVVMPQANQESVNTDDDEIEPIVVKVGVNASTTAGTLPRVKRSSVDTAKVLGTLSKFTKARFLLPGAAFAATAVSIYLRVKCEGWKRDNPPDPRVWRNVPPCPCNTTDAERDTRFEKEEFPDNKLKDIGASVARSFFHSGSKSCYRQANVR